MSGPTGRFRPPAWAGFRRPLEVARRLLADRGAALRRPSVVALSMLAALAAGKALLVVEAANEPPVGRPELAVGPPAGDGQAGDAGLLAEPAAGPGSDQPDDPAGPAEQPAPAGRAASGGEPRSFTPSELAALSQLAERRLELEERERELDLRSALLDDAEGRLAERLAELEALRALVAAMIKQHDEVEEAKFARLVKIYESMKPKAAAAIFDRLEMKVLVEVVSRMREGVSSEVIGRMNPERAEGLTEELARRRRLPPLDGPGASG